MALQPKAQLSAFNTQWSSVKDSMLANLEAAGFTCVDDLEGSSFRLDLAEDAPAGSLADVVRHQMWEHYRDRNMARRGLALAGKAIATAWSSKDGFTIKHPDAGCRGVADQGSRLQAEFGKLATEHHYPLTTKGTTYYRVNM